MLTSFEEEKLRSQLGDKFDAFKQELSSIDNRVHPMDIGPNSANSKSYAKAQSDRDALYQKYGAQKVTPPLPSKIFGNLNPVAKSSVNQSVPVNPSIQPAAIQSKLINRNSNLQPIRQPIMFDELRNRFKK